TCRLRLRARREATGAEDGEGNPWLARGADADARGRLSRGCHLPCARTAASEDRRVIARLRGRPVANTPEGLVLDVGGVGYLVAATPSAVRKADAGDEVALHTYLHVREDALQLYGFAEVAERDL